MPVPDIADHATHEYYEVAETEWDRTPMPYYEVGIGGGPVMPAPPAPLEEQTKAGLLAEIDRRNEGRADDMFLSRSGSKADLIATLQADSLPTVPAGVPAVGPVRGASGSADDKEN